MRPPIVTILGHVDHGKTTLLDNIRKSNIASREAGGITQGIGASTVDGVTFIDTPGHAAFSSMREQGAKAADIVVLVVAADDGVMPQTREAIKYITETKTRFIVALTKMDLKTADKTAAIKSLVDHGVQLESEGGDVPLVEISAAKGSGIKELLEMVKLVWEVMGIKSNISGELEAVVIETSTQKGGPEVWVVVKKGQLKVGKEINSDGQTAKIRGLFNDLGKSVKEIGPGFSGRILGFKELPSVGSMIKGGSVETRVGIQKREVPKVEEGKIPVVLRADNAGGLEALVSSLPKEVSVISKNVGDAIESDIFTAKSAGADVFVFGSRVGSNVKKLADTESVQVEVFDVIYNLIKKLEEVIEEGKQKVAGQAEIVDSFPYNTKTVAGCRMTSGFIDMNSKLILMRGDTEVGKVKVVTLRKQKEEVRKVSQGEEFGIVFRPQLDFEKGDVLLSVAD